MKETGDKSPSQKLPIEFWSRSSKVDIKGASKNTRFDRTVRVSSVTA